MRRFVVVKVSYDYHRFEKYLGIYSNLGINKLPKLPTLPVKTSQELSSESVANRVLGKDIIHYMLEEIQDD
jgi:hypothetical protein